jgi:hypothetical protein
MCWRAGHAHEELNMAVVIPKHKKGGRNDCSNYRRMSLLNSSHKIYSKFLNNRISKIAENIMLNNQHGFRKGRSCTDSIFTLTQFIEKEKNIISQFSLDLLTMKRPSIE